MNHLVCLFIFIFILAIYLKHNNHLTETFDNFPHNNGPLSKYLTLGGHTCTITRIRQDPIMLEIYPFLSPVECRHLIKIASPGFSRSPVVNKEGYDKSRTSHTSYIPKSNDPIIKRIETRITEFFNIKLCNLEALQVVRYEPNQQFGYHYDWFDPKIEAGRKEIARGGQRLYTLFVYLNNLSDKEFIGDEEPNRNGNTCFRQQKLCIRPREGLGIFWKNMIDGELNYNSLHSGIAPKYSTKYGLNVWVRDGCWT